VWRATFETIAASFARRETRLPAFDFVRLLVVIATCRIAVRQSDEAK
jgi:hypothetical protein